jgi:uncharacterized protein YigA (DUF484 family)
VSRNKELAEDDDITEAQVRKYLEAHPGFLSNIPVPKRDLGDGVEDFQHYLLKNLQNNSKSLSQRYDLLVDYCRENLSAQGQVHKAALKVIRSRSIEQLLELLTVDMLSIFDLDIVRIAMESEVPFDTTYGEQHYSGIVFIELGTSDALFYGNRTVLLFGDTAENAPLGFESIFINCEQQVESCALLRLSSDMLDKNIILAFGVRHKDRFHEGQGVELLDFLAQVVAMQFDRYLDDLVL